jgi:hypothetical protein
VDDETAVKYAPELRDMLACALSCLAVEDDPVRRRAVAKEMREMVAAMTAPRPVAGLNGNRP